MIQDYFTFIRLSRNICNLYDAYFARSCIALMMLASYV